MNIVNNPELLIIECEAAYPIKPEIINGLIKLVEALTGEEDAEFSMHDGNAFISYLKRLGGNARFDLISHMKECTQEEQEMLLKDDDK